jgi:predicted permease
VSRIEEFIFSIIIIIFGLFIGNRLRWMEKQDRISSAISLENIMGWMTKTVFIIINPLIMIGAFWNVILVDAKMFLLPLLGILSLILGGLFAVGISKIQNLDRSKTGSMFVSGSFSNMGNFGTLFCFMFLGEESLVFVAMFRLLEEFVYYSFGFPIAKLYGKDESVRQRIFVKLLTDPFIMATLLAILIGGTLNFSPIVRPEYYGSLLDVLVPLGTVLLVITVGYNMRITALHGYIKESFSISAVKFIMVPLCIVPIAYLFGIGNLYDGMVLKVILILTVMPPAFVSLVPPKLYGLNIDLANASWLINTALIILLLPALYLVVHTL